MQVSQNARTRRQESEKQSVVDEDAAGHNLAVTGASPLGGRCGAHGSKEQDARERPALAGYEGEVGIRHGLEGYFAASAFAVQIHDREVAKQVLEIGRQRSGMVSGAKPHTAGRMWDLVAQAWLRCPCASPGRGSSSI